MKPVKTYTYLDKKEKVFGLEIADFLLLALAYAVTFTISADLLINIPFLIVVYAALRLYKHGKPPKYTATLIRFVATPWRNWRFCCASEKACICTSDNPFIFVNPKHDPKLFYSGHGLAIPSTEIYFPVDSCTYLNLSMQPTKRMYAMAPDPLVEKFNMIVAQWANRNIYCAKESVGLAAKITKLRMGSFMRLEVY